MIESILTCSKYTDALCGITSLQHLNDIALEGNIMDPQSKYIKTLSSASASILIGAIDNLQMSIDTWLTNITKALSVYYRDLFTVNKETIVQITASIQALQRKLKALNREASNNNLSKDTQERLNADISATEASINVLMLRRQAMKKNIEISKMHNDLIDTHIGTLMEHRKTLIIMYKSYRESKKNIVKDSEEFQNDVRKLLTQHTKTFALDTPRPTPFSICERQVEDVMQKIIQDLENPESIKSHKYNIGRSGEVTKVKALVFKDLTEIRAELASYSQTVRVASNSLDEKTDYKAIIADITFFSAYIGSVTLFFSLYMMLHLSVVDIDTAVHIKH